MKNAAKLFLTFIAGLLFHYSAYSQVPQAINYQGVARDGSGYPITNRNISIRFSVRSGSSMGQVEYAETRNLTTNDNGLYVTKIGTGSPIVGTFSQIAWKAGNKWLQIEIDINGGGNYVSAGNAELLSVPYAFYAAESGNTGPTGPTGATGPTGLIGPTGPTGAAGATGPTGPPGQNGKNGKNGTNGTNGTNGVNGQPGATGPTGLAGQNGATGPTGPAGQAGATGATGAPGSANVSGSTNRIVKFSNSTTGGNSQIFDNGTSVGINTTNPNSSALLELASTSQGFLVPRMSEADRDLIQNPAVGLIVYNLTTNCINLWSGSMWKQSCFDCSFAAPVPTNNSPVCIGSDIKLSCNSIPGATYSWTGPNGFTSTLQNPTILNSQPSDIGSYHVTATVNGCQSAPVVTNVTVGTAPNISFTYYPTTIAPGDGITFSPSINMGVKYDWSFQGATPDTSTQDYPTTSWSTGGNFTVTLTVYKAGCTATSSQTVSVVCPTGSKTFSYTGSVQSFMVPACITSLTVDAYGAQGGISAYSGTSSPGKGGRVQATLSVTPGDVLYFYVGGKGGDQPGSNSGGYNGGGTGGATGNTGSYPYGGGGGGASDFRFGNTNLVDRILVAGGGGAPGGDGCNGNTVAGGDGGGTTGANGGASASCQSTVGSGQGGTQSAGGAAGCYGATCGLAGTTGMGGNSYNNGSSVGAGGGGGYYGGGGSAYGGGGGGSSYVDPSKGSNVIHTQGVRAGNGEIKISW